MAPSVGLVAGLCLAAVAGGLGRLMLGRLVAEDWSSGERLALFVWTGLTALAYAVLAVGLLGYLSWQVLLALVMVVGAVSAPSMWRLMDEIGRSFERPTSFGWAVVLWGMVGLCVLFAVTGALCPPTTNEFDSLTYHLAAPKLYVEAGRIVRIVHDHHTNSPFNMEMLYTLGLAFGSESLAKSFHLTAYLLIVASVAGAARRLSTDRTGNVPALAAAIAATLPPAVWEAGTAYVDLGTALAEWLALLALVEWWRAKREHAARWLVLCGVACGTALATKLLGGAALLFAILAVGYASVRRRGCAWRGAAGLVGRAALLSAPWFVKSYVYTGNPIYPYGYSVFGGADWDEACAEGYRRDQKTYGLGNVAAMTATGSYRPTSFLVDASKPRPVGPISRLVTRAFDGQFPSPVWGIPITPFFLTFDGPVFWESPMAVGIIGPIFLAFLPALALCRPLRPWVGISLAFAGFSLVAWWFTTQLTRYLIPLLVALAAPTALAINTLAGKPGRIAQLVAFMVSLCLAVNVLCSLVMWTSQLPVATGSKSRTQAIAEGFEQWELVDLANHVLGPTDRVALYGEPRGYYFEVPYLWADAGHHTLFDYSAMATADDLLARYRELGVTAVLVNKAFARSTYEGRDPAGRLLAHLLEDGRLEVVRETKHGVLYRLVP